MGKFYSIITNYRVIIILVVLLSCAASFQSLKTGGKTFDESGRKYTRYNNYVIFKQAFIHLKEGKDLYKLYPEEHWDYYKYSPSFAVFFGVFSYLPDMIGVNIWNLLNSLILLLAIYYLPKIDLKTKALMILTILIELRLTLRMSQSNTLMAGLIILSFALLEREKYIFASLCIVSSAFIKIFGIAALLLYLFYPLKVKLSIYTVLWTLILSVLPLFFTSLAHLMVLYQSWFDLLSHDYSASLGVSLTGMLNSWNISFANSIVLIEGLILFVIPFINMKKYNLYSFRLLALSSVLLWVVLFNHKAESSSYIIAMSGVSVWFFSRKQKTENIILLIFALFLCSLTYLDFFPAVIREEYIVPYVLKALPCAIIWGKILYEMLSRNPELQLSDS